VQRPESVSVVVPVFRNAYGPLVHDAMIAPFPARSADDHKFGGMRGAVIAAEALERLLQAHAGVIAAVIVEPLVQGASGMRFYHPEYLRRARELCTRHGVLLIADEIMTGFGRTGTLFACGQAAIAPDLMCLSKGITGGYLPLSCVLATDDVYAAFYDDDVTRGFLHSHSYTGNALACRAALAVLDIIRDDDVIAVNRAKSQRWSTLAEPLAAHPRVRGFRQRGMIVAFNVDEARDGLANRFAAEALRREIVLRPIGSTVYFMPPYTLTDDEFAFLVERTLEVVDAA